MINKKLIWTFISLLTLLGLIDFFSFSTTDPSIELNRENEVIFRVKGFEYDHNINFCGEKVPLHSQDIFERLDREMIKNAYWHSEIILFYKRYGKYWPEIEPIFKKYKIPKDFIYLLMIESGFDNLVSPAGASGFWQIMEKTAQDYGLEVTSEIDERYNVEKSTEAACKYLKEAYKKFGSWTAVAASYNMGMGGLQKRMNVQNSDNVYDLLLNIETSRYIFRIIAVKEIIENPDKFGFNLKPRDQYKPIKGKKIEIKETTNLYELAKKEGVNYKIVRILNPWIRSEKLVVKPGKSYTVVIPTENFYVFKNFGDSSILNQFIDTNKFSN